MVKNGLEIYKQCAGAIKVFMHDCSFGHFMQYSNTTSIKFSLNLKYSLYSNVMYFFNLSQNMWTRVILIYIQTVQV